MTGTEETLPVLAQPQELTPAQEMAHTQNVASACREIVKKRATTIGDKQYVQVEGWQAIATAHGCVAGADSVQVTEYGVSARGFVKRIADGVEISTAEGYVGNDESMWAKRPMYARRAMAQTRAISRACRSAFAHVVVLIDGNLSTTPAEEVPDGGFNSSRSYAQPAPASPAFEKQANATVVNDGGEGWRSVQVPFGKNKGKTLGELAERSLGWYAFKWEPKPKDDGSFWPSDADLRQALDQAIAELGLTDPDAPAPSAIDDQDNVPF